MKHVKTKEVPATTRKVTSYTCDLCGGPSGEDESDAAGAYRLAECTIMMKRGSSYPEGGNVNYVELDACTACFLGRIIPALEAIGMKPRKDGRDY